MDDVVVFHQRFSLGLQVSSIQSVVQFFIILQNAPFALTCRVIHNVNFTHAGFVVIPRELDAVVHVTVDGRGVAIALGGVLVDVERQEQALVGFEAQLAEIVVEHIHLAGVDDGQVTGVT